MKSRTLSVLFPCLAALGFADAGRAAPPDTLVMPTGCNVGDSVAWDGSAWVCAPPEPQPLRSKADVYSVTQGIPVHRQQIGKAISVSAACNDANDMLLIGSCQLSSSALSTRLSGEESNNDPLRASVQICTAANADTADWQMTATAHCIRVP